MSFAIDAQICSSNEEMDSFVVGDNTIEVTGAIIQQESSQIISNGQRNIRLPERYILSNLRGRKIRIVLWAPRTAEFEGRLLSQIVSISRGLIMKSNPELSRKIQSKPKFINLEELMEIEISIQAQTTIDILGPVPRPRRPDIFYVPIMLQQASTLIGQNICVEAYVKTKIESIVYNKFSYGSGAITDLRYRLPVSVTTFSENGNPGKGSHVKVKGQITENALGAIVLQVESMQNIEIMSNTIKSDAEMKLGFRAIRKVVSSDNDD